MQAKNTAVYRMSDKLMLALLSIDYKFLSIPLAFILLRLWSLIADVLHLYLGRNDLNKGLSLVLIILGVSYMHICRSKCGTTIYLQYDSTYLFGASSSCVTMYTIIYMEG